MVTHDQLKIATMKEHGDYGQSIISTAYLSVAAIVNRLV
jgi:hypothetical protein